MSEHDSDWTSANQRYLAAAIGAVRALVASGPERGAALGQCDHLAARADEIASAMATPPALEALCCALGLSRFERDLILLCAGVELVGDLATEVRANPASAGSASATFGLALATLTEPHWSALSPAGPLRRMRLLDVGVGSALITSPLRIDEQVLHHLLGVDTLDERVAVLVEPVLEADDLVPSHEVIADGIIRFWKHRPKAATTATTPIVQLAGPHVDAARAIAASACRRLGLGLATLPVHAVPALPQDLDTFVRLWRRQTALAPTALLVDGYGTEPAHTQALAQLCRRLGTPLVVAAPETLPILGRRVVTFDVALPTAQEQKGLWRRALGEVADGLDDTLDALTGQFALTSTTINAIAERTGDPTSEAPATDVASVPQAHIGEALWQACRVEARAGLDPAAPRVRGAVSWDDLVLPAQQKEVLSNIVAQVKQRSTVYQRWGFRRTMSRGLGITALFAGPSGTGKTLAAEALANALNMDLYQIDLSQIVSKYIGETEKNLQRVFTAADAAGAILLFDEADALFGKRSAVHDSHDRYANLEVSYLLQRMEAYRSLAILTTNMKDAIDPAFMRRLRFVVHFSFPDATQRREIWQRMFPPETPTEALEWTKLARLNASGGHIRNVALNAAFLAADQGHPVQMTHVLRAARAEALKLDRPLSDAEVGGWIA